MKNMVVMDMDVLDTKTKTKTKTKTNTQTKTNTKCFKDPMYVIFFFWRARVLRISNMIWIWTYRTWS